MNTAQASPQGKTVALIVAAGSGQRAGGGLPKQYRLAAGKPLVRNAVERFLASEWIDAVVLVIGAGQDDLARAALAGLPIPVLVQGGATRRESVHAGLAHIAAAGGCHKVLIHDAARPFLPESVIAVLCAALDDHAGAVPALPVVDSLSRGADGMLHEAVERDGLWHVQTPQAFRFETIWQAHGQWPETQEASDDARMAQAMGHAVALVPGHDDLRKFTFADDFKEQAMSEHVSAPRQWRTGSGYDVHRLVAGETLWLAGVEIAHSHGLSGHSDADVALHALTDAVLGAICAGDIGDHFPPSDAQWRGASSDRFLAHAAALAAKAGAIIHHVDLTIICEAPKIGPHKQAMRAAIARILGMSADNVSVKATTTEGLGPTGRKEGIAAHALATLSLPL